MSEVELPMDRSANETVSAGPMPDWPNDDLLLKPRRYEASWGAAYKQPIVGSGGLLCDVPTVPQRLRLK